MTPLETSRSGICLPSTSRIETVSQVCAAGSHIADNRRGIRIHWWLQQYSLAVVPDRWESLPDR